MGAVMPDDGDNSDGELDFCDHCELYDASGRCLEHSYLERITAWNVERCLR